MHTRLFAACGIRTLLGLAACVLTLIPHGHARAQAPDGEPAAAPPAQAPAPPAEAPAPPNDFVEVQATLERWGCTPTSLLAHESLWYAACGARGVWVVALPAQSKTPQLHAQHMVSGGAQSLFARDGAVWVQSPTGTAQVVPGTQPAAAAPSAAAQPPAAAPPPVQRPLPAPVAGSSASDGSFGEEQPVLEGRVVSTQPLQATISLGENDGLTAGRRIALLSPEDAHRERDEPVVGKVVSLRPDSAVVELGFGERAEVGQRVQTTVSPLTARTTFRERQAPLLELRATLRPGVPIGELGASGLLDAELVYRGRRHVFAELAVSPVGGLAVKGRDTFALDALAVVGYDHMFFSVGVGAGVMRWSEVPDESFGEEGPVEVDRGYGPSLVQQLRLGSRDGLHVRARNAFVIYKDEIQFGALDLRGQLPLGNRTWAIARGSWGAAGGYASFEVGLRRLVRGDGGSGSIFVSPTAGVLGVDQFDEAYSNSFVLGPMVGLSVEGRL